MGSGSNADKVIREVDWMRRVDIFIFDLLSLADGLTLNAAAMSRNIEYTQAYLNQRCRMLVEIGVLIEPEKGYFRMKDDLIQAWKTEDADAMNELGSEPED